MSREIKRVPLDLDWPLNKVWSGYLSPPELRGPSCDDCGGSGWTAGYEWLRTCVRLMIMAASDAAIDQPSGREMHPYLAELENRPRRGVWTPWTPEQVASARARSAEIERKTGRAVEDYETRAAAADQPRLTGYTYPRPTADIVPLVEALMGGRLSSLGGSSTDSHRVLRGLAEVAGLDPDRFGACLSCDGHGRRSTPEQRAAEEAWEPTEPPIGEGWQLWETVSEGSPISPVFATREELVGWLTTDYTWGAQRSPLSREQAEAFVGLGHSLGSMVVVNGQLIDGAAAVHELRRDR